MRTDEPQSHRWACLAAPLIAVVLLSSAACVGPLKQWGSETSLVAQAPAFSSSQFENERIGVLNAVGGLGLEGYAHQVSRSLSTALERSQRPINAISAHETLSALNEAGLAGDYTGMVLGYMRAGS